FQAEDGIRDGHVTGVQTCALPISPGDQHAHDRLASFHQRMAVPEALVPLCPPLQKTGPSPLQPVAPYRPPPLVAKVRQVLCRIRSEERRVGKEGGLGWWASH